MNILEMKHIKKSFGKNEVLKDISLEVQEGEILSIIGPSGSGKSTLLRCATLLEKVDGGEVCYMGERYIYPGTDGKMVYPNPAMEKKLHSIYSLVFQNFNLFPHYSVIKNVTDAPIHVQKRDKEEVYAAARDILAKVGLSEKENAYPCELSGGQQQRVAIARALTLNPKIIFFDEPTSALDPQLTGEVLKVIRQLAEMHMTMVIVTHEMKFARDISNQILFMNNGVVAAKGTPEEVFSAAETQQFLGVFNDVMN